MNAYNFRRVFKETTFVNPLAKFSVETLVPDCNDLIYVSPDEFLHFVSNSLKLAVTRLVSAHLRDIVRT